VDPALGEYIPSAPVSDEARKRNGNLPGMGGIYNTVNAHLYHYAGNNPVRYTDPEGRADDDVPDRTWTSTANYDYWITQINELTNENNVLNTEIDILRDTNVNKQILDELVRSGIAADYFSSAVDNILTIGLDATILEAVGASALIDPTIVPDIYGIMDNSKKIISSIKDGINIARAVKNGINGEIAMRKSKINTNNGIISYLKNKVNTHYCYDTYGQRQSLKL
jgi:hypothetical protein